MHGEKDGGASPPERNPIRRDIPQPLLQFCAGRRALFVMRTIMPEYMPARLANLLAIADILESVAQELAKQHRKRIDARRPRIRRGATLRPSAETPLWNAVAAAVKPRLRKRGDRALLARELDVHRARIGEYFFDETAMPDAERALQLLLWLSRQPVQSDSEVTA